MDNSSDAQAVNALATNNKLKKRNLFISHVAPMYGSIVTTTDLLVGVRLCSA